MASLLPNGKQQFIDANGAPLAGGSVTFYVPGTTTLKDTYQDAGATILNTNPVILDSAGLALVYGSGSYRQIVRDVLGNLVWDQFTSDASSTSSTWGNVSTGSANAQAITSAGFSNQDGQTVAFIAGFTNTGTVTFAVNGTTPIPVKADSPTGPAILKGGEIVAGNYVSAVYDARAGIFHITSQAFGAVWRTVEDFGVSSDISTDAAPAINAGLNFLSALGGGTLLLGRPTTYKVIGEDIVIPEWCRLEGQGAVGGIVDGNNYTNLPYCLSLGPGRTIKPQKNSSLRNLSIRTNILPTPTTFLQAYNAYQAFAGTAVTVGNIDLTPANNASDVELENLFIIGFNTAVSLVRADRFRVHCVRGDCTNGIICNHIHDIARANECHFWPFLVQNVAGSEYFECGILGITAAGDGSARIQTNSTHPLLVGMYVVIEGVTGTSQIVAGSPLSGRFKVKAVPDTTHIDLINVDGTATAAHGTFTGNDTDSHVVCVAYQKYGGAAFSVTNSERVHLGQPFCYGYDTGVLLGEGALWTEVDQPGIDNQLFSDNFVNGISFVENAYRNSIISGYISSVGTSIYCNTTSTEPNTITGGHFGATGQFAAQILNGCLSMTSVAFKGESPIAISSATQSVFVNVDTDQGTININPGSAAPLMFGSNGVSLPAKAGTPTNGVVDFSAKPPCPVQVDTTGHKLWIEFSGTWYYVNLTALGS